MDLPTVRIDDTLCCDSTFELTGAEGVDTEDIARHCREAMASLPAAESALLESAAGIAQRKVPPKLT